MTANIDSQYQIKNKVLSKDTLTTIHASLPKQNGNPKAFFEKIKNDLNKTNPSINLKTLGFRLGWDYEQWYPLISNRFPSRYLNLEQAKSLVIELAKYQAYTHQWQALETLQLLYPHAKFSVDELQKTALNKLESEKIPSFTEVAEKSEHLPTTTLPLGPTLIGRENELEQARNWLMNQVARILTVTGPGGVGKTSLQLALARAVSHCFVAGTKWIDLANLKPGVEVEEIAQAIATGLGLTNHQIDCDIINQLANYLADKKLLLVLDNFEHIQNQESAQLLAQLAERAPGLQIVVSSRELLRLDSGRALELLPLTYPAKDSSDVDGLSIEQFTQRYSAVALFVQQAQAVKASFELTRENVGVVGELCRRLDGLPLAIVLAARRINQFSPAQLLEIIEQKGTFKLLNDPARNSRHQTLTALIDFSYNLLSDEEKTAWQGMAVFSGGADLKAITAVVGHGLEMLEVASYLVGPLVDKSLLTHGQRESGEDRYYILDTFRAYALAKLREQGGEEDRVREDHARYYLALAEETSPKLNGPERVIWQTRLGGEYENIKTALEWLIEKSMVEESCRLAGAMGQYWFTNRLVAEGQAWLERVLGLVGASEVTKATRARVLFEAGRMAMAQDAWEKARMWSEESLVIWRDLGNDEGLGRVLTNLGNIEFKQNKSDTAYSYYCEALEYAEKLRNTAGIIAITRNLANIAIWQDRVVSAKNLFEKSLNLAQKTGNQEEVANCLTYLAVLERREGNLENAQKLSFKGLSLVSEQKNIGLEIRLLLNLGKIAQERNNMEEAKNYYRKGLKQCFQHGQIKFVVSFLSTIGKLLAVQENKKLSTNLAKIIGVLEFYVNQGTRFNYDYEDLAIYRNLSYLTESSMHDNDFMDNWLLGQKMAADIDFCIELALNNVQLL